MSIPLLQLMLKLPPALRCYTATPLLRQLNGSHLINASTKRSLSTTFPRHQPKPPKPTLRRPPKPQQVPQEPGRQPPKPHTQPRSQQATPEALLASFRQSKEPYLLLYKAPSHTSFYINSYILGSLLLTGAVMYGLNARDPPTELARNKPRLWVLIANGVTGLLLATFAALAFMAPLQLVKSISLIKNAAISDKAGNVRKAVDVALRFELKHPLPVLQRLPFVPKRGGGVIDAELHTVYMDRRVRSLQNMHFYPVPAELAQAWTAVYFHPPPKAPRSVIGLLKGFNESMVHSWPALKRNVRRMMLREGMADVRIPGHGRWKVDLQGCEILESGKVLERVVSGVMGPEMETWWDRWRKGVGL